MSLPWRKILVLALVWTLFLGALRRCGNNPWEEGAAEANALYTTLTAEVRNLDPAAANYTHEIAILANVVESPLAYHYLKRPYELIPQLLESLPEARYFDTAGNLLGDADPEADVVSRVEYVLRLRKDVSYQPHPCFAPESAAAVAQPESPWDFQPTASRTLKAEDFRVSLVRLCDPRSGCTVFSQLEGFLSGLAECRQAISQEIARLDAERIAAGESPERVSARPSLPDYRGIPCDAIQILDDHTVKFVLSRKYPQFLYWLAMHYFAPVPWEALAFFQREDVSDAGLSFGHWPVGTGAFLLKECDLDFRVVLERNPLYHDFRYPAEGGDPALPDAERAQLREDAGKRLPFLDRVVFHWEPESLPAWTKFLQGYYDYSGLPADMFDKALSIPAGGGDLALSAEMESRGIRMSTSVPPISYYYAFNQRDPVVGGQGRRQRLLRQAISIAIDVRQYIQIFRNGNGVMAEDILPPGIFGAAEPPDAMNAVVNRWDGHASVRRDIQDARRLMAEAGYPGGVDESTGEPLVLYLDHAAAGRPDFKSHFQWLSNHLGQLGIRLEERGFDLNRSRRRIAEGNWQFLYERGWVADYPDPENFLMLFASQNGHVEHHGPNYANYANPEFDRLFRKLETMPNSPERLSLIRQASRILCEDAPVVWDFHPRNLGLVQPWLHNYLPQSIAYDTLKYLRVDPELRAIRQREWNRPCLWPPVAIMAALTLFVLLPPRRKRRERRAD